MQDLTVISEWGDGIKYWKMHDAMEVILGIAKLNETLNYPDANEIGSDDSLSNTRHTFLVDEFGLPAWLVVVRWQNYDSIQYNQQLSSTKQNDFIICSA